MRELQAEAPRARYKLEPRVNNPDKGYVWYDIPEAEPHCRARLLADQTDPCHVVVQADGRLDYDPHLVEVDVYPSAT